MPYDILYINTYKLYLHTSFECLVLYKTVETITYKYLIPVCYLGILLYTFYNHI